MAVVYAVRQSVTWNRAGRLGNIQQLFVLLVALLAFPGVARGRTLVEPGTAVRCSARVCSTLDQAGEVRLPERNVLLKLAAHTKLRIQQSTKIWLGKRGLSEVQLLNLMAGSVDITEIHGTFEAETTAVLVRTGHPLVAVWLTGHMAVTTSSQRTVVNNLRGNTIYRGEKDWLELVAGSLVANAAAARVGQNDELLGGPVESYRLLPTPRKPELSAEQLSFFARGRVAEVGGMHWAEDPGVDAYIVRIYRDGRELGATPVAEPELPRSWQRLTPGVYELTVTGRSPFGFLGPPSEPLKFHVVGVERREGVFADGEGRVHLVTAQHAYFTHVDGLLMSFGDSGLWAPAARSVPVYGKQVVTVRFKHPHSTRATTALIVPNSSPLTIRFSPMGAVWPKGKIALRVERLGQRKPEDEKTPRAEVFLGLKSLPVNWVGEGDNWVAEIPTPATPGPWVVRAVVKDDQGVIVDRDFIEVATPKTAEIAERPALSPWATRN